MSGISSRNANGFVRGFLFVLVLAGLALPLAAQDDVTTQHGSSGLDGAWITGPASNPLSFLNGPAYRTFSSPQPYDFRDVHPVQALDRRLPHWLALEAEERYRSEEYSNNGFKKGVDDSYQLNRLRLQLDLMPVRWFKAVVQTQDARPFFQNPPIGPPNENRWDLKEAYGELGDPEKQWFSLRVGRQLINYNNTLMANSEWRNQGRSYDAAVMNLHQGRIHAGIFAASAVAPLASGISHHQEGNNIYGVYVRIENPWPATALEPFVLWRVQPKATVEAAVSSKTGKEDMKAFGLRLKGRRADALNYYGELAIEHGNIGTEAARSWAATGGASYEWIAARWRPRLFAQYDYASGNNEPANGTHHTFDTFYPTAHDRFGILDLFGWQNIQAGRTGATVLPHRRWTVTAQYLNFWQAAANDAAYNSSGSSLGSAHGNAGTHLGEEADVYSWYELNRHLNIGAGYGSFGAGGVVRAIGTAHSYSSSYVAINFKDFGRAQSK